MTGRNPSGDASNVTSAIALLEDFRCAALKKAAEIVADPRAEDDAYRASSFSHVASLLTMALDFLRAAGETLQRQAAAAEEFGARLAEERRLFEMAPSALLVTNPSGVILDVNREAAQLLERDPFQVRRVPLVDFLPTEDRADFRARLGRAAAVHHPTHWRFRLRRQRNVAIAVSAVVATLPPADADSGFDRLFWCVTPSQSSHELAGEGAGRAAPTLGVSSPGMPN